MNYNNNAKYNSSTNYNSASFGVFISIYDAVSSIDIDANAIAQILIGENIKLNDFMSFFVLHKKSDDFYYEDKIKTYALYKILEKLNIADVFSSLLVCLYIIDNQKAIDSIRELNALINKNEEFNVEDINTIDALIKLLQDNKILDAEKLFALIKQFDVYGMTDIEPRKAISDFIIGKTDDKDSAYDWIIPFDMKIDWRNSSIQVMPQAESNYIDMPGVDGSIIEDTTYKNRIFSIVAFSELGLSIYEKEQLKSEIAQILDATKNSPKKLTFQNSSTSFDVVYSGSAQITEGPSFVKATIPFESSPYGYPLFEQEVFGTGLLINNGDADTGCVHKISSGCVNPTFQLGSITYTWKGTVPNNNTLIIDHNNYSCYLETVEGNRTNVIDKLSGEFQIIPKQTSIAITANENTSDYLITTLKEKILW